MMVYWIKKFARIISWISFFAVFFVTLDYENIFAFETLMPSFLKAIGAAAVFWFVGFIVGDIVFKGIMEHVGEKKQEEERIEGGMVQRIIEMKRRTGQESGTSGKSKKRPHDNEADS